MNADHKYQVWFATPIRMSDTVAAVCSSIAGGVTLLSAKGVWVDESGGVEGEPIVLGTVSTGDALSVERLRVALHDELKRNEERCMWFTWQSVSGGLFALVDSGQGLERDSAPAATVRAVG